MGARQSKRSVDISNPPKKGEVEGGEGEGKVERLEEGDVATVKATLNGTAPHAEKEVSSPVTEEAQPLVNGETTQTPATPEVAAEKKEEATAEGETLANGTPESPATDKDGEATTPSTDSEKKKKKKEKKKWSFRSISFSKKDKSKPDLKKDEGKNGNVTKEEPVAEVVEAEAAAATEALPVKDEEPKKEETVERKEEEKKEEKKEEKAEAVSSPVTEVKTPEPAPTPAPVTPATPEPVVEVAAPAPAPVPVPEPVVVETTPEPVVTKDEEKPVEVVPVKTEELPPPLPASPPPTEAPPPTPVAVAPDVTLQTVEADSHECNEVVGGGGESMAEPEDVGPVSDAEDKMEETSAPPPMVNGHHDQFADELTEKVDVVTESLKTMIVTESIICTQVTETVNAEESEQTASAAE